MDAMVMQSVWTQNAARNVAHCCTITLSRVLFGPQILPVFCPNSAPDKPERSFNEGWAHGAALGELVTLVL
jgi:hypothetical protein